MLVRIIFHLPIDVSHVPDLEVYIFFRAIIATLLFVKKKNDSYVAAPGLVIESFDPGEYVGR